jgi:hypothetical protein
VCTYGKKEDKREYNIEVIMLLREADSGQSKTSWL